MQEIIKKADNFIQLHKMLTGVKTVIAGISGGADSVCLLWILKELSAKYGYDIIAVHINHGIRREACEDEAFTKGLCESFGVRFLAFREDVTSYAKENGLSSEEAGRVLRYKRFNEVAEGEGSLFSPVRIATAHHMGDQAETVLLNLLRGSGLTGMKGISPKRGLIIRPILCLTREEIEDLLKQNGTGWCVDATNATDDYTRNRIRNNLLPYVEENISRGAIGHICNTSSIISKALGFIEKEVKKACGRCVTETPPWGQTLQISLKAFNKEDDYIKGELLLYLLGMAAGRRKDIESIHVEILKDLCEREGNRRISLPYGINAIREYDRVIIFRGDPLGAKREIGEEAIKITYDINIRTFEYTKEMEIPKKGYTKWFDYDKIQNNIQNSGAPILRTRQQGDYLLLTPEGSKKTIKRLMIDEKIPPSLRDNIELLAQGSHVLWVPGIRTSAYYHISETTKTVWEVRLCQKKLQ